MSRLHEKIRDILDNNPQLTQRGLAAVMGLDPAAVNRMLHGRRGIMAEEIPMIEAYLGQKLDFVSSGAPAAAATPAVPALPDSMAPIPVRSLQGDATIDWTARHPAQAGIADAFAIYVGDDSMAPRYLRGETVYVHPHRPPRAPQDMVLQSVSGAMTLCRLAAQSGDRLHLQFFNPPREEILAQSSLRAVYAVVGRG